MKKLNILFFLVLTLFFLSSCEDIKDPVPAKEGGLIELKDPSINYVVGNPGPYAASVRVYQGDVKTTKIEIYKKFNSTRPDTLVLTKKEDGTVTKSLLTTALVSNTVLYATINITGDQNSIQSFSFTFDELRNGLTIEKEIIPTPVVDTSKFSYAIVKGFTYNDVGEALPNSDGNYTIGDNWEFAYYSTVDDGRIVTQNTKTKVTVATRYAGKYRCVDGRYFRLGVLTYTTGDWPAETYIESVDAKTYKVLEYWGAFDGNEWYFQIENGVISYPAGQNLNDQPMITCETNPGDMTEVCGLPSANTVVNDDVNGKDRLIMANGYYTAGSGPRVGYQVMEKIVE